MNSQNGCNYKPKLVLFYTIMTEKRLLAARDVDLITFGTVPGARFRLRLVGYYCAIQSFTRTPSVEGRTDTYPSPRPASPCVQCTHVHLYRSASAAGWMTTPTVTRHRPAGQPVSINGQPAMAITQTPSQTLVITFRVSRRPREI